jgi:uncharacterized protein
MRWQGRRQSSNVEDRRGFSAKKGMVGGGLGTIILVLAIYFLGGDPSQLLNTMQVDNSQTSSSYVGTEEENQLAQFVSVVLAETEDVWTEVLSLQGVTYLYPKLVIFSDAVESACGYAGSATGPFYCPGDNRVYIDLSFYNELQADYLAGVWAHHAERMNLLETGDLDEALNAASAVGDDRIQKAAQGYLVPDSFTHGSSEQRKRWFYKGFQAGDLSQRDTFGAESL